MTEKKEKKPEFKNIAEVLHFVQMNLHAPKNQLNKFGGYRYRSCEDILEGLKKVLPEGAYVTVQDDMVLIGNRYYVKAIASLCFDENCLTNTAFAREEESKKGMDASQITGSASSYARKYALNGLFLIDDTKDADAQENAPEDKKTGKDDKTTSEQKWLLEKQKEVGAIHVKEEMETYFDSDDVKEGIKKLSDEQKKWFEELKKKAIARVSKLADAEFDLIANGIERADTVENLLAAKEKYELAKPRMNDTQIKLIDDVIKRIESKIN